MIRFGPAGTPDDFKELGFKKTTQMMDYLKHHNLSAFEYQCTRGVRVNEETLKILNEKSKENNVMISMHAPYFISMSSITEETRLKSVDYILDSAKALKILGGKRIIFHSGSAGKITREEALLKAKDTMFLMQKALDDNGFSDIILCPETMGKLNQLGDLNEVLELCKIDKRITPCIDFGHLNARDNGAIKSKEDYLRILDKIEIELKDERSQNFHVHFSKIEYTQKGEKKHLTFEDTVYGPEFEPLMDILYERKLSPTIICESAGTQGIDAKTMSEYIKKLG